MIGVTVVAFNGALITAVDDTTIPTEVAVVICETSSAIDASVISSLEKDDLLTEKMGIVGESNTEITFFVTAFVMVLEFVAAIADGLASVAEGDMVADSAVEVRFKAVADFVGITMDLVTIESGAIVVSLKFSVVLVVVVDNEDIDGVFEIVVGIVGANVVILLDVTGRVKSSGVLIDVMRLDLLAVGTVALVRVELMVCWNVAISTVAGVVVDLTVVGNGEVGETFTVVGDTTVLMREAVEVSKASTLIDVFVVSSLGEDRLVTEDVETVVKSTIVVTSSFAVVIMVPKLIEAVVDAMIRVVKGERVVNFSVGESCTAVEGGKSIGIFLITVGFLAPGMLADNEEIEVVLKFVAIDLATNVVIFTEIIEPVISVEDVVEASKLNLLDVRIDFVFFVEFIVGWGVAVSAGANVEIGVKAVALIGAVGASIAVIVDDTTILVGAAVIACETSTGIEVSVVSNLKKDVLVLAKIGIVGGLNTVVTSFVVALVIVFEFVATVIDDVTLAAEGGVEADSAVVEIFKVVKEGVAVSPDLIAVSLTAIEFPGVISVTLVVVADSEDIRISGVLEIVGITIPTKVVIPLVTVERDNFAEGIIEAVRLDLIVTETVDVERVAIMGRSKVFVSTGAGDVIDIAVFTGNGSVVETIVCDTTVLIRGVVEVFETSTLIEVFVVAVITEDVKMMSDSAIVVTSFSPVVITVLKIVEAVVDVVIPITEVDRVVEFILGKIFKSVEKRIGIRMA